MEHGKSSIRIEHKDMEEMRVYRLVALARDDTERTQTHITLCSVQKALTKSRARRKLWRGSRGHKWCST